MKGDPLSKKSKKIKNLNGTNKIHSLLGLPCDCSLHVWKSPIGTKLGMTIFFMAKLKWINGVLNN